MVNRCQCCGLSHYADVVELSDNNPLKNGIVATYVCPINKSMGYLKSIDLEKGVKNDRYKDFVSNFKNAPVQ